MKRTQQLTAIIEREGEGYVSLCPELDVASQGDSIKLSRACSKIRVLSGKEVCSILLPNGFLEVRRKGSHVVMQKRTSDSTIMVPVPDHVEWKTGTLMSIIRQSQLSPSLFEN